MTTPELKWLEIYTANVLDEVDETDDPETAGKFREDRDAIQLELEFRRNAESN